MRQRHSRGFTLIEMIIVVAIIALLATIVTVNLTGETDKARLAKAKADLAGLETALNMYKLDNFHYPSTEQGLRALVQKPAGSPEPRNWRNGGYVRQLPADPWGNPYQYLNPGRHGAVDVFSFGADGALGGEGENADVGNWDPDVK
jgi:general secretion pathway protein G